MIGNVCLMVYVYLGLLIFIFGFYGRLLCDLVLVM